MNAIIIQNFIAGLNCLAGYATQPLVVTYLKTKKLNKNVRGFLHELVFTQG